MRAAKQHLQGVASRMTKVELASCSPVERICGETAIALGYLHLALRVESWRANHGREHGSSLVLHPLYEFIIVGPLEVAPSRTRLQDLIAWELDPARFVGETATVSTLVTVEAAAFNEHSAVETVLPVPGAPALRKVDPSYSFSVFKRLLFKYILIPIISGFFPWQ